MLSFFKKIFSRMGRSEKDKELPQKAPVMLPVNSLVPNPHSKGVVFIDEGIEEIAERYHQLGIIEPVIVKPLGRGKYLILLGERRWYTAKHLNLEEVPCFIQKTIIKE